MKVLVGGLIFVLAVFVGSGLSLTCYSYSEQTGREESECEVDDPALQTATGIDQIERLCYTFQSIQNEGKIRKVQITRGCSTDNKIDTCEKLKETLLIGKQAKTALTNCSACYSNYCNYDPNWTENDSPSNRQERQFGAGKRPTPPRLVPPAPKPVATTPLTTPRDEERSEEAMTDEPEQNGGGKEEIGMRQGAWGQGLQGRQTTRNPYNSRDNSREEGEGRGDFNNGQRPNNGQGFGSGINGQPRPGPGWTNNGQLGNNFGQGINGQARPGPGWTNNGQLGGQAKPGINNGQTNNNFGQGINGQARPGPGWTNNGQLGGNNGQGRPGPDFGEQTEDPFGGENIGPGDNSKVGQNPDGTWKTGVQYAGENKKTTSPYQAGAKPFPTHRPQAGGTQLYSKDKNGPPRQASSAECVRNVAIFVVSSVFVLLSL